MQVSPALHRGSQEAVFASWGGSTGIAPQQRQPESRRDGAHSFAPTGDSFHMNGKPKPGATPGNVKLTLPVPCPIHAPFWGRMGGKPQPSTRPVHQERKLHTEWLSFSFAPMGRHESHALMAGMTIEVSAQQLGHKDMRITMRQYATFARPSNRSPPGAMPRPLALGARLSSWTALLMPRMPAGAGRAAWCRLPGQLTGALHRRKDAGKSAAS
jgi:hypothetical protein